MKTRNHIEFPTCLSDLYEHPDFIPFGSENGDCMRDSERWDRCHDAAEHGAEGSTHAEIMGDWREFLERLEKEAAWNTAFHPLVKTEIERRAASIREEIDKCEAWHEEAGSLNEMVG